MRRASGIDTSEHVLLFFCNDAATSEIYTLSLLDALPISLVADATCGTRGARPPRGGGRPGRHGGPGRAPGSGRRPGRGRPHRDRKSTRLNSSHANISYAVFCLKKKKSITIT